MKHGTMQLVKFKKLHRRLGFATYRETAGLLEVMWLVAARETPRGDLGQMDNETIAIELEWNGDPDHLVKSLVETRWLDPHPEHRLVVHDWADHAARFVHGVAAKKGGMIVVTDEDYSRGLQSWTTDDDETPDSPQPAGAGTTIPNHTLPNQRILSCDDSPGESDSPKGEDGEPKKPNQTQDPPRFLEFWEAYPPRKGVRRGRKKCVNLWRGIRADERDAVILGAKNFAHSDEAKQGFAKDPERWLRDRNWLDWQELPEEATRRGPSRASPQHVQQSQERPAYLKPLGEASHDRE